MKTTGRRRVFAVVDAGRQASVPRQARAAELQGLSRVPQQGVPAGARVGMRRWRSNRRMGLGQAQDPDNLTIPLGTSGALLWMQARKQARKEEEGVGIV